MKSELYLGLDVDKEWMVIALAEWGRNGAVQAAIAHFEAETFSNTS